jgi:EAL domain-containing protein (putative c-di-GMP-specific phosphodiesterase class I)
MNQTTYMKQFKNLDLGFVKNFTLLAQPIVSLQDYQSGVEKFEFLAKFLDESGKNITPDKVFTKNRTNEQLKGLDLLVFNEAMGQLSAYQNYFHSEFKACINVSEVGVEYSKDYFSNIETYRKYYGIHSKNIALEITEFAHRGLRKFTQRALSLGYEVSVDDFASEHSAPGKIIHGVLAGIPNGKHPNVNIKLDKSFVEHILNKSNPNYYIGKGVFEAFLGFKKDYPELALVAEGVETFELANHLEDMGVDYGQGFLWSKAIPLENYSQPNYNILDPQTSFNFK